jgi:hypothetical protein
MMDEIHFMGISMVTLFGLIFLLMFLFDNWIDKEVK